MKTRRVLSLEFKLPLLIIVLLAVVIGGFTIAAYREMRREVIAVAAERLERASAQILQLLSGGAPRRLAEAQALAAHPAVAALLRNPQPSPERAVMAAARELLGRDSLSVAVEVWTDSGSRLLAAGRPFPAPAASAAWTPFAELANRPAAIGPLRRIGESLYFFTVAVVSGASSTRLGWVVVWRRAVGTNTRQIAALIGSDAEFLVGNAAGDVWSDLTVPRLGPPTRRLRSKELFEYDLPGANSARYVAYVAPIPETPWVLLVQFPQTTIIAPVNTFAWRIGVVGLALVALGALGAWGVSHRIAPPLKRLTVAVEQLGLETGVAGLPEVVGDEIQQLAGAFDAMATALERRKGHLSAIVQTALDAVITMDDTGTITDWNPRAEATFGWSAAEAIRRSLADTIIPPADRDRHRAGLVRFLQTGVGPILNRRIETVALHRDGHQFDVELTVTARREGAKWVFSAFVRDISVSKRAELVQAATYSIAAAAKNSPGLMDLLRAVHEIVGTLMPARNFYIALYDEASDLMSFPYFVDEHDPAPAPSRPGRTITAHVLRTGQPLLSHHDTVPGPDGDLEWVGTSSVDWLGVPLKAGDQTIGVLAVQTYTEGVRYTEREQEILQFVSTQVAHAIVRKRGEEALRSSEERFRALVEHSGDAIALFDPEGRILYVSQSATRVSGREPPDLLGKSAFDFFHPDDVPELRRVFAGVRSVAGAEAPVRARFLHHDGSWRDGEGTLTNRLHDPSVGAIVINYRDVTDRHRLETQLQQAQKMEAVGRLAGGVAHDFNNVLTAIFGYTDLLAEGLPAANEMRGDLDEIRKAAQRAAGLTRQLLAFSRQQVLQPVVMNLNDAVENLDKMLRRLIGADVAMHTVLAASIGNVRADPGQIEQVIMNLAVNARDAMPMGGQLTLETSNAELTEQYAEQHQPVVPGPYVMLAVSDTGTGITPEVKARLFEPFFTTKEKGKGTGLGLATVYGIVKQSGGYIWAYSEPSHGATFKVYLPRVDAPVEAVQAPELKSTLTGTETILLAEDDELLRPLATSVLNKLGYTVLNAKDAPEALARAQAQTGRIHLLITDVVMPGMSGRELARKLAVHRPDTHVLFISGYTDDAIVRHGMLEPGLHYLQKPFTPSALARKVREVLEGS